MYLVGVGGDPVGDGASPGLARCHTAPPVLTARGAADATVGGVRGGLPPPVRGSVAAPPATGRPIWPAWSQVGMDVADAMARSAARAAGMTTMRPLAVVQGLGVGVGVGGGERARASDALDSSSLDLGA